MTDIETTSTRPYLIRALYEWCTDNGLTPHLAVRVDGSVQVPQEFVKQGEIVLNVSLEATSALKLGDEFIEFKGRFGGVSRDICVPVQQVMAIYARENGQGMSFPINVIDKNQATAPSSMISVGTADQTRENGAGISNLTSVPTVISSVSESSPGEKGPPKARGPRPSLKSVK